MLWTDYGMRLELVTVNGHARAMLVCDECDSVRLDSDSGSVAMVSEIILCDHENTMTLEEYLEKYPYEPLRRLAANPLGAYQLVFLIDLPFALLLLY